MEKTVKFAKTCFTLMLTFVLAGPVYAQASSPSNGEASQTSARSYRLNWTVNEIDDGKRISTQHFAMVVTTGGILAKSILKIGSKVPVATGSLSGGANGVQTQFQYLDVGLNIQASLEDASGGALRLNSKIEQSSVADNVVISNVREPIIRQAVLEGTSVVIPGKMLAVGSLDVPGSTHHLEIEVVLEQIK